MNGWPMRYGPRHWEGVPGVRYPEAEEAQPPKAKEAPEGWLTTAQAAGLLHVSAVRARAVLRGAEVAHAVVAGGRLAWEPEGALRVAAGLPPGWCTAEEACRALGCGLRTLRRHRVRWGLATLRVRLRGRVCTLFDREQADRVALVRAAAAGAMAGRTESCTGDGL